MHTTLLEYLYQRQFIPRVALINHITKAILAPKDIPVNNFVIMFPLSFFKTIYNIPTNETGDKIRNIELKIAYIFIATLYS